MKPTNIISNPQVMKVAKIAAIITIVVILYLSVNKINDWLKGNSAGKITPPDENLLSYSKSNYVVFADKIEQATSDIFDDEAAINQVFANMLKIQDVEQLILAFGTRWYVSKIGIPLRGTLPQVLTAKLTTGEIADINSILKANFIEFNF